MTKILHNRAIHRALLKYKTLLFTYYQLKFWLVSDKNNNRGVKKGAYLTVTKTYRISLSKSHNKNVILSTATYVFADKIIKCLHVMWKTHRSVEPKLIFVTHHTYQLFVGYVVLCCCFKMLLTFTLEKANTAKIVAQEKHIKMRIFIFP